MPRYSHVHNGDKKDFRGKKRLFETAEELYQACLGYFEWNEKNPLYEEKVFQSSGQILVHNSPKPRAMSIVGLCNYLDIGRSTWQTYRKSEDYEQACEKIEAMMYQQKFENAMAGLMNPQMTMRDLGLVEKSDVTNHGTVTHVNYSPADYKQAELELGSKLDDLD